jgi:hypothetical protein
MGRHAGDAGRGDSDGGYGNSLASDTESPSSTVTRQCSRRSRRGSGTPQLCAIMPTSYCTFFA